MTDRVRRPGPDSTDPNEAIDRSETGLRGALLRFTRVPERPEPPPGDPSQLRVFRAGESYLRYRQIVWVLGQIPPFLLLLGSTVAVSAFVTSVLATANLDEVVESVPVLRSWNGDLFGLTFLPAWGVVFVWILYAAQAAFSFVALKLDYEMRWYMLSDQALRIRHGVFTVREQTMTYANLQQISVRRGPIQKLLGLGDVEVRTAGGGGTSGAQGGAKSASKDLHRGFFKGVDEPEAVRDLIRTRVERYRETGLGDPDDHPAEQAATEPVGLAPDVTTVRPYPPISPAALDAAARLLDEIVALRGTLTRSRTD